MFDQNIPRRIFEDPSDAWGGRIPKTPPYLKFFGEPLYFCLRYAQISIVGHLKTQRLMLKQYFIFLQRKTMLKGWR